MRSTLLKLSRAIFNWPPQPGPESLKQSIVTEYGRKWNIGNFIETGTFEGKMTDAQKENFRRIVTIELDRALYASAKQRFKEVQHIHVLHGDSGVMLVEALRLVNGPTLFWLDAHYSGGVTAKTDLQTPILKELSIIASRGNCGDLILIDDARLFGWRSDYPPLAKIRQFVTKHWPDYKVDVESDLIHIVPQRQSPPDFERLRSRSPSHTESDKGKI
jgi:hypothetical protein